MPSSAKDLKKKLTARMIVNKNFFMCVFFGQQTYYKIKGQPNRKIAEKIKLIML
jgi:hypothetical protein